MQTDQRQTYLCSLPQGRSFPHLDWQATPDAVTEYTPRAQLHSLPRLKDAYVFDVTSSSEPHWHEAAHVRPILFGCYFETTKFCSEVEYCDWFSPPQLMKVVTLQVRSHLVFWGSVCFGRFSTVFTAGCGGRGKGVESGVRVGVGVEVC